MSFAPLPSQQHSIATQDQKADSVWFGYLKAIDRFVRDKIGGTFKVPASTTTAASLNIAEGSAPTSPADGDIWFDGTDLSIRVSGVTKTFTLT